MKAEARQTYALKDAVQAHRDLEARLTTGSTVLLPWPAPPCRSVLVAVYTMRFLDWLEKLDPRLRRTAAGGSSHELSRARTGSAPQDFKP